MSIIPRHSKTGSAHSHHHGTVAEVHTGAGEDASPEHTVFEGRLSNGRAVSFALQDDFGVLIEAEDGIVIGELEGRLISGKSLYRGSPGDSEGIGSISRCSADSRSSLGEIELDEHRSAVATDSLAIYVNPCPCLCTSTSRITQIISRRDTAELIGINIVGVGERVEDFFHTRRSNGLTVRINSGKVYLCCSIDAEHSNNGNQETQEWFSCVHKWGLCSLYGNKNETFCNKKISLNLSLIF